MKNEILKPLKDKIYMNRQYIYFKTKYLTNEISEILDKELIVEKKNNYMDDSKSEKIILYKKTKKITYIPKFWGIDNIGFPNKKRIFNLKINENMKLNKEVKCIIKLRDKQINAVKNTLESLKDNYGTMLSVHAGFGKTVCSLYIAKKLGLKTLIVVHTTNLLDQWKERISTFLPNSKIGIIKGDTFDDIKENDFTISMIQTLISSTRNYDNKMFNNIGLTIYDEAHHISAPSFFKCVPITSSIYNLGLSATPKRKDKLEIIFKYCIGDIGYSEIKKSYSVIPNVEKVFYTPENELEIKYMRFSKKINYNHLIKQLIEDEDRNKLIKELTIDSINEHKDKQILLVSHRILHIKYLKKIIDKELGEEICGLYIGGMSKDKLLESSKKRVIIASYSLMAEGTDIPTLNTLILCTPTKDIEQVTGRILRADTGLIPIIYDIIDDFSVFKNQFFKRNRFYKKHYNT